MTSIHLSCKNPTLEIPSIKTVKGNLHQRINQRHKIKQLEMFLENHPMNASRNYGIKMAKAMFKKINLKK